MTKSLPVFGSGPIIVALPAIDVGELVAAVEVMWQEGLRTWSVAAGNLDLLVSLAERFGLRATLGVHGVVTVEQGTAAAQHGADFVAATWTLPGLVTAVTEVPVVLGGLSPSELVAAGATRPAAVQVLPADALSATYVGTVMQLLPEVPLIAAGDLSPDDAQEWCASGAAGVWTTALATAEAVTKTDLDSFRADCQAWARF